MLAAQTELEQLVLVTADSQFAALPSLAAGFGRVD
jgi:hypothetical protein